MAVGAPDLNPKSGRGQDWYATLALGFPFANATGAGAFAQIVKPSLSVLYTDVNERYQASMEGQTGLDLAYPYAGYSFPVGQQGNTGDSPSVGLDPSHTGIAKMNHDFTTWLMFLPDPIEPGQRCAWVPLRRYSWNSSGRTDAATAYNWFLTSGTLSAYPQGETDGHPEWDRIILAGRVPIP